MSDEKGNIPGRWDENDHFIPGVAVTHTREHDPENGPPYCKECTDAVQNWVQWPCRFAMAEEMAATRKDISRVFDVPLKFLVEPCIGRDPTCPCQDGLACHYKDYPAENGWPAVKGWPIPDDDGATIVRGLD